MPPDPLAILARLRRLDVTAAQRRLAEARGALAIEETAAAAVEAALRSEGPDAAPATYGAYLARLLAARQAQAAAMARAGAALEAERAALATARTAGKVIDTLREGRAAAGRRSARRRDQHRLEEASLPAPR